MLKKRLFIIFCLVLVFIAVAPLERAKAGTGWEKWFSNGSVETRPARYISVYSAELVGYVDWKNRHGGQDLVLSAHFKYIDLTDSSKGWQTLTVTPVPTRGGEYAEEIHGLVPGHTYRFYTYVKMTSSGSHEDSAHSQTFTTIGGNGSPWSAYSSDGVVATSQPSGIGKFEAVLRGHVEWQNRHAMIDLVRDAHFKYIDLTDSSQGWQSVTVTPVPTSGGDYSVRLKGLAPGHTYKYYTYLNMTMTGGHEDSAHTQTFTTEKGTGSTWSAYSSSGIVATMAAENVTQYSADLKGHVEWQNKNAMIDLVRDAHFKYQDLTDTSKGWQSVTVTPVPSGGGDFTVNLKGLTPGHDYQFYAYLNMTVSGGHDDSAHTMSFSTLPGNGTPWETYSSNGVVATLEAANVTKYGADLKGYVKWQNRHGMIDLVKGAHFWYTDNTNKYAGDRTVEVTPVPSNGGYFTAHLSGLVPGHTYMFYACVDMTVSGSHNNVKHMQSFTTQPGEAGSWQPPNVNSGGDSDGVLATLPATNVGQYSADLNCHVEWQNKSNIIFEKDYIIELGFNYSDGVTTGKTTSALFWPPPSTPLHTKGGDYTVHLKGLQPGHTYTCFPYVIMQGTESKWMSEAPKITFTTLPGTGTPWRSNSSIGIIATLPASNVADSSAILRGHAEWENQNYKKNLVKEAGFRYQDITSGEKDWKTKKLIWPPSNGNDFSATISGLTKGHAYRFYPFVSIYNEGTYDDSLHAFVFTAGGGKQLDIKASLPIGVVGKGYNGTLTAAGGDGNYTYSGTITAWDSSIPEGDGLHFYPNGVIAGTPKAATPTSPQKLPLQVWATVVDSSGNTGSGSFAIDVIEQLRVTTASLPGSLTGVPYKTSDGKTVTLAAAGGTGPYKWSGTITPANGLTFNSDGSITGTPQSAVTSKVHVLLKDSAGRIAETDLSLPVFTQLKITSVSLPGAIAGSGYQSPDGKAVALTAAGGDGKYTWSGTITPANGLTLKTDGAITGTPQASGESTVNAAVSDGSGNKVNGSFKITVYNKLQITTSVLPGGLTGAAYQTSDGKAVTLTATGGAGKYTWSGTITPANGTLQVTSDGKITGVPDVASGSTPLTVAAEVKDSSSNSAKASFKLFVNDPLPPGIVGQLYTMDLAGSGGDGKYTWSGTITPANGTLKVTSDGKINGTPLRPRGRNP
ncbi:hypothetical protein [Syntrophomonas palmitatica]|uniref:hypothetical protein n=1 Tax=Syntrophomonas palmitatica TaxID=402877 RepID=UPI0006CFBCBE|nr:hypothetical protein [Syntrophomonas palmitatica]